MAVSSLLHELSSHWVLTLILGTITWFSWDVAYRLFLSPLAKFPGPKLAALTGWYETYFDCIKRGRFWVEIEKMHEQYGPIVRISPWEIHVNDPDWNESFKISSRVNKYHWYYKFVGSSDAAFGTADHELHRVRRKAQQNYFTQEAVSRFDPVLESITTKLINRLKEFKNTGKPANISNAFRSLATDVVTEFSFHKSHNLLDQPDFAAAFNRTVKDFPEIGLWHRHFGLILDILDLMPRWLTILINPAGIDVVDFFNDMGVRTNAIVADYYNKSKEKKYAKPNVIHQMLDAEELSAKDKSNERLALEVRTFVGAGTETTGNTLTSIVFYLLANPEKLRRLKEEIREAQKKCNAPLRYQDLQQLPYLNAVVLEGLRYPPLSLQIIHCLTSIPRISTSVSGRLPRVNTREAMAYKSYTIPINTPVSMTQKLTHDNATIFPSPRSFLPERWLVAPEERKRLEKYLQPFGRGSRSCIGIHLANSEIYVTLAALFSHFDLELHDTVEDDIKQVHDFFSPFPESNRGLRVLVS
ncbi:cytochrome P450 [Bisporella sp. PMI_857]|nr:cytochrome P450 [Bisporella sp. PMI_857]